MENHTCNGRPLVVTGDGRRLLAAMTPESLMHVEHMTDFLSTLLHQFVGIGHAAFEASKFTVMADLEKNVDTISEAIRQSKPVDELIKLTAGPEVHKLAELLNVASMCVAQELAQHAFLCGRHELAYDAQKMAQDLMQKVLIIAPENTEARMLLAGITAAAQEGGQQETPQ